MKTILLYLLLFLSGMVSAQNIDFADGNFKYRLLLAGTLNNYIARDQAGQAIVIDTNNDGEIQVSEALTVYQLNINYADYMTNLNPLIERITDLGGIEYFTNLNRLTCSDNNLTFLNISALVNLQYFETSLNSLDTLNLDGLNNLNHIQVSDTNLTTLDFSSLPLLDQVTISNNSELTYLSLKNGFISVTNPEFFALRNNPSLLYVCADEAEIDVVTNSLLGQPNVAVSSYCSFTPGGDYNTITGTLTFDADGNGCDAADATQSFIKVKIDDGTNAGYTFTNAAGIYTFYTQDGTFTVTPEFEDNQFFTASPVSAQVVFPVVDNTIATENFCITPNGTHRDVEVVMVPLTNARPGFDALYKIVYKNKGNQVLSGRVSCGWDTAILSPVTLDPYPDGMEPNTYSWNYTDLQPFENREILMTLNVNSPTEVPAVNDGDVLPFTASVNSGYADDTPDDNYYEFNQTVVNSLDPNNIVCIEGDTETTDAIGDYLHYVVNFENTGTAPAEFVVITHDIDPAEFDVTTVEVLNASHDVKARINGNRIEFAFNGIQLGVAAHGNILFKLKSRASLQEGDVVVNRANIFFDYNNPLLTNDASTVFAILSAGSFTKDASVQVYPNPAKDVITVKADGTIQSLQLYDIQGRLLQTTIVNSNNELLNISSRTSGMYFIKVTTDRGVKVEKIIKE